MALTAHSLNTKKEWPYRAVNGSFRISEAAEDILLPSA